MWLWELRGFFQSLCKSLMSHGFPGTVTVFHLTPVKILTSRWSNRQVHMNAQTTVYFWTTNFKLPQINLYFLTPISISLIFILSKLFPSYRSSNKKNVKEKLQIIYKMQIITIFTQTGSNRLMIRKTSLCLPDFFSSHKLSNHSFYPVALFNLAL